MGSRGSRRRRTAVAAQTLVRELAREVSFLGDDSFEPKLVNAAKQLDDPLLQLGRIGDIYMPKVARFGR